MSAPIPARELFRQSSFNARPTAPGKPTTVCPTCGKRVDVETLDGVSWLCSHPGPRGIGDCRGSGTLVTLGHLSLAERMATRGCSRRHTLLGHAWVDAAGREVVWRGSDCTGDWYAAGNFYPDEDAALLAFLEAR